MFFNYQIIYLHTPTKNKSDEDKERFYTDLDNVYVQCPKDNVKMIIGGLNANVGTEEIYQATTGKYSLHNLSNDNGNKRIYCAASLGMTIVSTGFQHRDIHRATWISSDGNRKMKSIMYILIHGKLRT